MQCYDRVVLVNFFYTPLTVLCTQAFLCTEAGADGRGARLVADTSVACDAAAHRAVQAVSGVLLACFTLGIPLYVKHVPSNTGSQDQICGLVRLSLLLGD